ncbi:hypothetical protein [Kribbella sp. NPDC051718]|uniref:hypothetical protein n=1 Tax=Kribbella sp. NPDC051718 TaxID=3155168 RepID=UPI003417EFD8
MTAQNSPDQQEPRAAEAGQLGTDPLGPITLPERSRIGSRAFALVGAASVLSIGLAVYVDYVNVTTSVSAPH